MDNKYFKTNDAETDFKSFETFATVFLNMQNVQVEQYDSRAVNSKCLNYREHFDCVTFYFNQFVKVKSF